MSTINIKLQTIFVLLKQWGINISYGQMHVKSFFMCPSLISATHRQKTVRMTLGRRDTTIQDRGCLMSVAQSIKVFKLVSCELVDGDAEILCCVFS